MVKIILPLTALLRILSKIIHINDLAPHLNYRKPEATVSN